MAIVSPFFVASRLRNFRDVGREGFISFGRSYAYTIFVFFYGAVLLAVVQYLYFAYFDNGYLVNSFAKMMSTDEGKLMLGHQPRVNQERFAGIFKAVGGIADLRQFHGHVSFL